MVEFVRDNFDAGGVMNKEQEGYQMRAEREPEMSGQGEVRIAVVDDDFIYRQVIENSLRNVPNCKVVGYDSGEEYVRNYESYNPHILVLDYFLSEKAGNQKLNGLDVLQIAKHANKNATVILITGSPNTEIAVATLKSGASDYIIKDKNGLVRLINHIRKVSVKIKLKEEEERINKWIGAGVLIIGVIVIITLFGDDANKNTLYYFLSAALIVWAFILFVRSWMGVSDKGKTNLHTGTRRVKEWFD